MKLSRKNLNTFRVEVSQQEIDDLLSILKTAPDMDDIDRETPEEKVRTLQDRFSQINPGDSLTAAFDLTKEDLFALSGVVFCARNNPLAAHKRIRNGIETWYFAIHDMFDAMTLD